MSQMYVKIKFLTLDSRYRYAIQSRKIHNSTKTLPIFHGLCYLHHLASPNARRMKHPLRACSWFFDGCKN